jgi:hypothetical protein
MERADFRGVAPSARGSRADCEGPRGEALATRRRGGAAPGSMWGVKDRLLAAANHTTARRGRARERRKTSRAFRGNCGRLATQLVRDLSRSRTPVIADRPENRAPPPADVRLSFFTTRSWDSKRGVGCANSIRAPVERLGLHDLQAEPSLPTHTEGDAYSARRPVRHCGGDVAALAAGVAAARSRVHGLGQLDEVPVGIASVHCLATAERERGQ